MEEQKLPISLYARISCDIEKEDDVNTSVENQISIMRDYVNTHFPGYPIVEYRDRDRSGYTFIQREEYQKMRQALISGASKILIVKDFSRFARRNSLGLYELEQLRDYGVRIISIMDNVDYPTHNDWLMIQFRFLANELPVTDTSRKIRTVITNSQKKGEWLCSAPYGYRLITNPKLSVEIVPEEAAVVRQIFEMYNNGWGYKKIVQYLSDKNVPTPTMSKKIKNEQQGKSSKIPASYLWNTSSIEHIVNNDFYIGTLRQHKYTREKINGRDVKLSDDDHIVFPHHHEAIIDDATFMTAQEQRKRRKTYHYRGVKKYATDYTGFLFCGDCGSPMFSRSRPDLAPSYICGNYHKYGLKCCTSHHIRCDFLDKVLKDYIQVVVDNSDEILKNIERILSNTKQSQDSAQNLVDTLNHQLTLAKNELRETKKQKIRELSNLGEGDNINIIEEAYRDIEDELVMRINGIQQQIEDNINIVNKFEESKRSVDIISTVLQNVLQKDKLDKSDIEILVDKIIVYENNDIEIHLKDDVTSIIQADVTQTDFFELGSVNISQTSRERSYVVKNTHRLDKVYTVNVIDDGDPSCITLTQLKKFAERLCNAENF